MLRKILQLSRNFICFLCVFITVSSTAAAVQEGRADAISVALCNIVQLIQGDIAKAVATIAVIFMAFGLFSGKVTWTVAIMTVIAISCVMGADGIVRIMIGWENGNCYTLTH